MGLSDWKGKKLKKKKQNTKNLICLESLNIFASKTIKELLVLFPSVSFSQEQLWLHRTSQLGGGGDASENQSDVLLWGGGEPEASFVPHPVLTLS